MELSSNQIFQVKKYLLPKIFGKQIKHLKLLVMKYEKTYDIEKYFIRWRLGKDLTGDINKEKENLLRKITLGTKESDFPSLRTFKASTNRIEEVNISNLKSGMESMMQTVKTMVILLIVVSTILGFVINFITIFQFMIIIYKNKCFYQHLRINHINNRSLRR